MAQEQTVRDAMTENPRTIGADATVSDAARAMRDENVSIIAVVDDSDELIGVITDRDIAILVVAEEVDANSTRVGDAMSTRPVTVDQDQSLDDAFQRMVEGDVHRAPVTENGGQVSGMLSQSDAERQGEGRRVSEPRGSDANESGGQNPT
jgi:CBS domain-containing protein